MSSLSTLPKGDSAWLFRKAIERIMQQVSVLETNIGVSTSGNSANTEVIFNDDGTLRGDAGLVYNKTTDALTVAGLVTAGSATITGALDAARLNVTASTIPANGMYLVTTNKIGFSTNSIQRLNIDATGNILSSTVTTQDGFFGFTNSIDGGTLGYVGNAKAFISGGATSSLGIRGESSVQFSIAANLGMTLNSTGLGIGDSPSYKLHVSKTTDGTLGYFRRISGTINPALTVYCNETGNTVGFGTDYAGATSPSITFTTAGSERLRIDATGNLLVGTTSSASSSGSGFKVTQPVAGHLNPFVVTSANSSIYSCWDIYSTGGTAGYRFFVTSTGTVNAISATISAISDGRLKENVKDIDVGLSAILALKPRTFDWKAGKGKGIKGDRGFIAQEFETVFPNLIDEWKDPAPEGEAPYKSVRQDLIPVLVKAIQELAARVQTLEAR